MSNTTAQTKIKASSLKPIVDNLYHNEPSWDVIVTTLNTEFLKVGVPVKTVSDAKSVFEKFNYDLRKRPRFNGRKIKAAEFINFDDDSDIVEEMEISDELESVEMEEENN